jgi:hypothetical protein
VEDEVGSDLLDRTNNPECIDTGSWCGCEDQDQVLGTNRNFSMAGSSWITWGDKLHAEHRLNNRSIILLDQVYLYSY